MSEYWKAILKRAGYTAAETALALIGTGAVYIHDVNWKLVLSASALAAIVTILKCIVFGVPEVAPAKEATEDDVKDEPVTPYPDENYDDLKIDDDVDEGEDEGDYDDEVE